MAMAASGDPGWAGAASGHGSVRIRDRPRAGVRLKGGMRVRLDLRAQIFQRGCSSETAPHIFKTVNF